MRFRLGARRAVYETVPPRRALLGHGQAGSMRYFGRGLGPVRLEGFLERLAQPVQPLPAIGTSYSTLTAR